MSLTVIIVGTGIAGLTTSIALAAKGHNVTVLDATPALQTVGGLLTVQPNASRVLDALGIYDSFLGICSKEPFPTSIRRYADGSYLSYRPKEKSQDEWGYPYWSVHRADYQRVLYDAAIAAGVAVRFDCAVIAISEGENREGTRPTVVLKSGERIEGDVVVGADGIKSIVRSSIFPDEKNVIVDSGLDCTRIAVSEESMNSTPETAEFMINNMLWFGPGSCIASVPILRGGAKLCAFDLHHPRDANSSSADGKARPQDLDKLKGYYVAYAPVIHKILSFATEAHVWRLVETKPASCVSKSGKIVLIGDATHGVLPFVGQGGGMAVEDAAALSECLDFTSTNSAPSISDALHAYRVIRTPRNRLVQEWGNAHGKRITLPDGPEQEERDRKYKEFNAFAKQSVWDGKHRDELPESLESGDWVAWMLGYDAVGFTRRELEKIFHHRRSVPGLH